MSDLGECHDRLRRTQFDLELLDRVAQADPAWRRLANTDRAEYLKGRCVAAETYDYFGRYSAAAEALSNEDDTALERELSERRAWSPDERTLRKFLIWMVVAKAQVKYRAGHYGLAAPLLEQCLQATNHLDPNQTSLFGTRARLAHFHGQVSRQRGDYQDATRKFAESVFWASRRFVEHTPFAELSAPVATFAALPVSKRPLFDQARLLASWTIGKSQALGLGWIDLTTGKLASAEMHLAAGYAMLRSTGDWVHRAYCVLLQGVVLRARAGMDVAGLNKAITLMQNAKDGLTGHPFGLRACYELAQAHLRLKETDEARREIDEMLRKLPPPERCDAQQRRWRCNGTIVKSRIERIARNFDIAEDLLRSAETLAADTEADKTSKSDGHSEAWVEAKIARGEVLLDRASDSSTAKERARHLADARRCFEVARDHGSLNPKTVAVCRLHLARVRFGLGDHREAHEEYAAGLELASTVEHGFMRWLAGEVAKELQSEDCFFISSRLFSRNVTAEAHDTITADDAVRELRAFLVQRAEELASTKQQAADMLQVSLKTMGRWKGDPHPAAPSAADAPAQKRRARSGRH